MLEKVREYFIIQYADCKRAIDCRRKGQGYGFLTEVEYVNKAIDYCLSVAMFAQTIGIEFDDIDPLYNEYKEKLENLLTK